MSMFCSCQVLIERTIMASHTFTVVVVFLCYGTVHGNIPFAHDVD